MTRLLLTFALLLALIHAQSITSRMRDTCVQVVEAQGLDLTGTRAEAEVEAGFWYMWGVSRDGQRWGCTLEERWWGLRVEDVTVYELGD